MKTTKPGKQKLYFRRQSSLDNLYNMNLQHQDDSAFATTMRKRGKEGRSRKNIREDSENNIDDEHGTALSSLERNTYPHLREQSSENTHMNGSGSGDDGDANTINTINNHNNRNNYRNNNNNNNNNNNTDDDSDYDHNEIPSIQGRISHELLGQVTTFHDVDKAQRLLSEIESQTEGLIFVVKFTVPYSTAYGQQIRVTGSLPQLGDWNAFKAPQMEWTPGDMWICEHSSLFQDKKTSFEYKYVVTDAAGNPVRWEGDRNKRFVFDFDTIADEEQPPNMKIEVSSRGVVTIVMQDKWQE